MDNDQIEINLHKDEVIVLFEPLSRFSEKDELEIQYQDEERVLLNLTCFLKNKISELFSDNYRKGLEAARGRIIDKIG